MQSMRWNRVSMELAEFNRLKIYYFLNPTELRDIMVTWRVSKSIAMHQTIDFRFGIRNPNCVSILCCSSTEVISSVALIQAKVVNYLSTDDAGTFRALLELFRRFLPIKCDVQYTRSLLHLSLFHANQECGMEKPGDSVDRLLSPCLASRSQMVSGIFWGTQHPLSLNWNGTFWLKARQHVDGEFWPYCPK